MPKIVYIITEDWSFLSHRVVLARACRAAGWDVVIATRVSDHGDEIRRAGFVLEPLPLERGGMNPFADLRAIAAMVGVLRRHRPDIVHTVALKPNLYGNIAAMLAGSPPVVSAITGIGSILSGAALGSSLLRRVLIAALRLVLNRRRVTLIVQNDDDRALAIDRKFAPARRIAVIRGSGVDLRAFPAQPLPPAPPVVFALVARMLADKGVPEAVEATRLARRHRADIVLRLIGAPDPANPMSLTEAQLRAFAATPGVEWLGPRGDIAAVWRDAHAAILPSWREGLPKSLLEALASARPVITTDTVGCRDVIEDGVEGVLVPLRDPAALAAAMERLADDAELRARMAAAARARAEARFGEDRVVAAHLDLYRAVLAEAGSEADSR